MNSRVAFLALYLASIAPGVTHAVCVKPPSMPIEQASRSAWNDLINLAAERGLNPAITLVQRLDTTGDGDMNLDYYAVTIDAAGQTPAQLLATLRKDIEKYIYEGTTYKVGPYDASSESKWASSSPVGAIMVFTLAGYAVAPLERGAVVVSCADAASFVFSTVQIAGATEPGDHPVSGNRGFGVVKNEDGSLTVFTKAADRRKGNNEVFKIMGSEKIFALGAEVWTGLLENLKRSFAARHPRSARIYRRTVTYP